MLLIICQSIAFLFLLFQVDIFIYRIEYARMRYSSVSYILGFIDFCHSALLHNANAREILRKCTGSYLVKAVRK